MLSDAAYGFVVFAVCLAALLKFPRMQAGMRKYLRMFMYCGISTMFWGCLLYTSSKRCTLKKMDSASIINV